MCDISFKKESFMMLSAAVLLLMVAMVASDSNDMTKSEVTLKTDTKSILDLLVKLMNAEREEREKTELVKQDDDTATSNQVIYCLHTPELASNLPTSKFGQLNIDQLEVLARSSITSGGDDIFVITSDGHIISFKERSEINIYSTLQEVYSNTGTDPIPTPAHIWFNKVPCPLCITRFIEIFEQRGAKPTLHFESLNLYNTDMSEIEKSMGCLARLQLFGFSIVSWDWNEFESYLDETVHCKDRISTVTMNLTYLAKKDVFSRFMGVYDELCSYNKMETWCM